MSEVTLLTYGGGDLGEYIIFYQDGKGKQIHFKSSTLPNQEMLQAVWDRGDQLDLIAFGKQEWCVLIREKPEGHTTNTQEVSIVDDGKFDTLEKTMKAHWSKGRIVRQIVFGNGKWVLLTEKPTDAAPEQKLVTAASGFPEEAISKNWDAGLYIRSSAFGNGKYALVFEKGEVPQSLYMDKDFPEEEIEDLWADCYSVSGLLYGDGKWVLISNEQTRNNHQGWVSDTMFPEDDLEELLCAGGLQPKLPPATQVQGMCKTGWLQKKAPANWKAWKKRWFVLSAKKRTCYYYADQTDERPKGYFFTNGCTVGPCEDAAIEKKHPNTFQVHHPIRRTFYVQAPDQRTRDEWIKEIQALLDEDYDRKKTEIEKFIEDIYGNEEKELEWGQFIARMKEILEVIDEKDEDNLHFIMHKLAQDDNHDPNVVDTKQITAYVSAFGFVEDSFDKLSRVAEAWHGIQTKDGAEKLLEKSGKQPGMYAVWLDLDMLKVVVSAVNAKGKVEHKTISWDYSADQFFIEEDVLSHNLPVVFRAIDSCMQNSPEWRQPVKSDIADFLPQFEKERKAFLIKWEKELKKRQEEQARLAAEAAAAEEAAAKKSKKGKKDKGEKGEKSEKKKRGKGGGKKRGGKQAEGDTEDGGGKKKKSKGKKSKKSKE